MFHCLQNFENFLDFIYLIILNYEHGWATASPNNGFSGSKKLTLCKNFPDKETKNADLHNSMTVSLWVNSIRTAALACRIKYARITDN